MEEEEFIYNMRSDLEDTRKETIDRIKELMDKGYSTERISRYLELEPDAVKNIIDEQGLLEGESI